MAPSFLLAFVLLTANILPSHAIYNVARDYSGDQFFSLFDYYGNIDNASISAGSTTGGDVNFLDQADATSQQLAYVSPTGTAIVKVDNSSIVPLGGKRNSMRLTSTDAYPVGSLFIIDASHLPFGCSVWPAVWTTGEPWPTYGEIDIIEGVNEFTANEMVIHSQPGCTKTTPSIQTSKSIESTDCSTASGCVVQESAANSYGAAFAQAGGGVYAMQYDVSGIFIWFWSRPNVPASITTSSASSPIDISTWGHPSAAFPSSSCNMGQYFGAQKLVIDITLCGDWAGVDATYRATCPSAGATGVCNINNVVGSGEQYSDAYFEFNYIRTYTMDGVNMFSTESQNYSSPTAATTVESVSYQTAISSTQTSPSATTTKKKSAGMPGPRSSVSGLGLVAGLVIMSLAASSL
ncbi:glycoside hydrolase family 16 protein [Athelia psychrophila]|uniref:Glycoside hydrolase family 16 protein n=1 Tax=Athelia psychrophila TaxID=1759441 RepID=A0A166NH32_9AGAM|nr:glycoside hydrolase family 16 protein [Fibularhizoctonia sp. CBS 109695]